MIVQAKFKVHSVTDVSDGKQITLGPVTSGSKENEEFFKWTPAGQIVMSTLNLKAAAQFEVGAEFLVTFARADG